MRNNFSLLLVTATALYLTFTVGGWTAGFMCGTVAAWYGTRVVEWGHDRWLAKHGYRRGHVPLDQ
jgi:hypothetical protein